MNKVLLSVGDVAARYQVTRTTVCRWFERRIMSYYSLQNSKGQLRTIWLYPEQLMAFEKLHLVQSPRHAGGIGLFNPVAVLTKPQDLADHYGVHLTTILRWCEKGYISHYNFTLLTGGKRTVRFDQAQLDAFELAALITSQAAATTTYPA